jgi:hypothetical protein
MKLLPINEMMNVPITICSRRQTNKHMLTRVVCAQALHGQVCVVKQPANRLGGGGVKGEKMAV